MKDLVKDIKRISKEPITKIFTKWSNGEAPFEDILFSYMKTPYLRKKKRGIK
jgi:hypothetical protein